MCNCRSRSALQGFLNAIKVLLYGWLPALMRLMRRWCRYCCRRRPKRRRGESPTRCLPVSHVVYRRPDPLLYSQKFLKSQGLAVTWDNPDIQLYDQMGMAVSSKGLMPDTQYEVRARIWNNSTECPAVHIPVKFIYMNYGVGQKYNFIGQTTVTVPVKGAPGHPAFTSVQWKTPATPGMYCILVELVCDDDANPLNNVGQENTTVKKLNSPKAKLQFPLRNDTAQRHVYRLRADDYVIPKPPPCASQQPAATTEMTPAEIARKRREAVERHGARNFSVPPGWTVDISPEEVVLAPEEEQLITVDVTAPGDNFVGTQSFNVNAFDEKNNLAGGVTLVVEG